MMLTPGCQELTRRLTIILHASVYKQCAHPNEGVAISAIRGFLIKQDGSHIQPFHAKSKPRGDRRHGGTSTVYRAIRNHQMSAREADLKILNPVLKSLF